PARSTLSLPDALPISGMFGPACRPFAGLLAGMRVPPENVGAAAAGLLLPEAGAAGRHGGGARPEKAQRQHDDEPDQKKLDEEAKDRKSTRLNSSHVKI